MMGQYSTGKTSFIKALLGKEYPGCHTVNHNMLNMLNSIKKILEFYILSDITGIQYNFV